ncbi:MAG: translation initiation factor IF-2 [Chloroflexi bacterium]|nr:translation initiation factor IF-2 [Chloroflexota bacterium]
MYHRPRATNRSRRRGSTSVDTSPTVDIEPKTVTHKEQLLIIPAILTVKQLADLLAVSPIEVIKHLMKNGVMASINQTIDYTTAAVVASDFGYETKEEPESEALLGPVPSEEAGPQARLEEEGAKPRPPVITIMGHVDHGKTRLLDAIRKTNVMAGEAGGITQHIGAYQVEIRNQKITFLDTPGHEAFTAMRARGARVTDIAVLVVAADDGVMPQTLEAIDHARAAGVPIVVAINKIDKPEANLELVKKQLADAGILIEEWGGDVVCVPVSARMGQGIPDLLENLLIVAEMAELKANPIRPAVGVVIEAELDSSRGPLATVLVQNGTLKVGDSVVLGSTWGRIKAMFDDKGKRVKRAEPATPVVIMGLGGVPQAGDFLRVVESEKLARAEVQQRQRRTEQTPISMKAFSLDELSMQIEAGQVKELNIILKTDVQGSIDPIKSSLERLSTEKARVKIIHATTGNINESDVMLALASQGIIIGFNARPEPGARRLAEVGGVDIRVYDVIYNLVEDVERALSGLKEPTYVEIVEGHAQVRQVFPIGKRYKVAGVYVSDGKIGRGTMARVLRRGQTVWEANINSLKRFKDDVREVMAGFECGIGIEGYNDYEEGDVIEVYRKEKADAG